MRLDAVKDRESQEPEAMIIVGEPALDAEADAFLRQLRERFALPICYQQLDFQARKLVEKSVLSFHQCGRVVRA